MSASFRIAIGTTAIDIKQFSTYRPNLVGDTGTTYSLSGTAIAGGVSHEPKFLWEIGTILEDEQCNLLRRIYAQSEQLRRGLGVYSVLIYDTITPISELTLVNSRALVPTTAITPDGLGGITYFAQFRGGFVAPPKIEPYPRGDTWQVDFSIAEHDRVMP